MFLIWGKDDSPGTMTSKVILKYLFSDILAMMFPCVMVLVVPPVRKEQEESQFVVAKVGDMVGVAVGLAVDG